MTYLLPAVASGTPKRQRKTPLHIQGSEPIALLERCPSTRDYVWCCDALTMLQSLPSDSVDFEMTSPPYDDLRTYNGRWSFPFEAIAREAYRVLKVGGVLVWNVGDAFRNGSETLTSMRQALYFVDTIGFRMHQRIVWEKKSLPKKRHHAYMPDFEDVFILSKGAPATFNPVMKTNHKAGQTNRTGHNRADGFHYDGKLRTVKDESILTNVWTIAVGGGKTTTDKFTDHSAAYPEELARRCIQTWSNPGDTVLDFFAGSGTTLKMARNLDRHYIGCDISETDVIKARNRLKFTDPYQETRIGEWKVKSMFSGMSVQERE